MAGAVQPLPSVQGGTAIPATGRNGEVGTHVGPSNKMPGNPRSPFLNRSALSLQTGDAATQRARTARMSSSAGVCLPMPCR